MDLDFRAGFNMSESIKVICRVRPLNDLEKANDSKFVVSFPGDGKTAISIGVRFFGST